MDSVGALVLTLFAVVVVQRGLELRVAKRNEAWAREQGATEFGAAHYPLFFLLHGGWILGWLLESWNSEALPGLWWLWVGVFALAQGLRYWAIGTLGQRWNTRVLVIAGVAPIARGPYGILPHPNYLAVVLELAAVPLAVGAPWTAVVAGGLNAVLLLGIRIPCEMRALRWASEATPAAPEEG